MERPYDDQRALVVLVTIRLPCIIITTIKELRSAGSPDLSFLNKLPPEEAKHN